MTDADVIRFADLSRGLALCDMIADRLVRERARSSERPSEWDPTLTSSSPSTTAE